MWHEMQSALGFEVCGELLYEPANANVPATPVYSAPPLPRFMSACGPWWVPYEPETVNLPVPLTLLTIEALVEGWLFRRIWWHSAQMCPFALFAPHTAPVCVVIWVPTGIV